MEAIVCKNNIKLLIFLQSKLQSGEPMDRWINGSMDHLIDRWMDGWVDRLNDQWIDGSMDGWMDQIIYELMD